MTARSTALALAVATGLSALVVGTAGQAQAQGHPVGGYGNHYYFAGAGNETGKATRDFRYGNPDDVVLVGDWDGNGTDGLIVRRGNHFLVRNDLSDGIAEHEFVYGDPGDTVLVGSFARSAYTYLDGPYPRHEVLDPGYSADGADQLVIRRGNQYIRSEAVWWAVDKPGGSLIAVSDQRYGNPDDTAFIAELPYTQPPAAGVTPVLTGDGLAVRRND